MKCEAQPDLFNTTGITTTRTARPKPQLAVDIEAAARLVEQHEDYRVLRRLKPRQPCGRRDLRPGEQILTVIDTETTGLDHKTDQVIELGLVSIIHDADGVIVDVMETYSGLQEPTIPLPAAITTLTGITPEMLAGQRFDMVVIADIIGQAHRLAAHNAGFDRPFVDRLLGITGALPWACSLREIDWAAIGSPGQKLEVLLAHYGMFHGAHRAVDDCHAVVEVLAQPHPAGGTLLRHLVESADRTVARIWAINSPFEAKDALKARGYRWHDGADGQPKSWWIDVDETQVGPELDHLQAEVYRYPSDPIVRRLTAADRYRAR